MSASSPGMDPDSVALALSVFPSVAVFDAGSDGFISFVRERRVLPGAVGLTEGLFNLVSSDSADGGVLTLDSVWRLFEFGTEVLVSRGDWVKGVSGLICARLLFF